MSNKYEQRFFSALKDTFVGHKIKGKSGYVNLLDLKQQYFAQIEPYIKKEIDSIIEKPSREELYEKLYSFFDSYLNETGTVFFANSQLHKNLYERVYSDRDDVSLFWKTQKLYYVKSEAMYDDLETEISGITYVFDASDIKHAKGNEKKSLAFYLVDVQLKKLTFKVRYQEQTKFDRLKEYLEIEKPNEIKDHLIANFDNPIQGNINVLKNNIDRSLFNKKGDLRDCIYCYNETDALNTVTIEFSPSKVELIHFYCNLKSVICREEEIKKAFHIYKKQNEVDYFIHKDAESFLKEQFDIYTYNWLFNDLKTDFDAPTVKRFQNIKKIAHIVIEYIAKFENELKAIWEKPKFVRNSNYVFTFDKVKDELKTKLISIDLNEQIEEWIELELVDSKFTIDKINSKKYSHLPFDTRYLDSKLKFEILSSFDNLHNLEDGVLIKSDNWQALNTLKTRYKSNVDLIYIDPPFNTGSDFVYKDKYQDSTWLTLMENRLLLAKEFISTQGSFLLHLDHNADYLGRLLLDNIFGSDSFRNEIIWGYGGGGAPKTFYPNKHDTLFWYTIKKEKGWIFNKQFRPYSEKTLERGLTEVKGDYKLSEEGAGLIDVWNDDKVQKILSPTAYENVKFVTQKPEGLLNRIIFGHSNEKSVVMDFFSGSGTTFNTAHKLGRKWISVEMGDHYYTTNLPRIKKTLSGFISGISTLLEKEKKLNKGGIFKYYELEQYEDVLARALYKWKEKDSSIEKYSFMQDQKLLEVLKVDYESKNVKILFQELYPDVDIAETLSNLTGKPIKELAENYCVLVDKDTEEELKIVYNEMTFEKYPWIKPLIWWHSK